MIYRHVYKHSDHIFTQNSEVQAAKLAVQRYVAFVTQERIQRVRLGQKTLSRCISHVSRPQT